MSAVLWCWHIPSRLNDSQGGHNLFIIHQTLSEGGEGAQILDCCLWDVYLPLAVETPAHWILESCKNKLPS